MYGTPLVSNSLSFGKILGGLSKTLSVANQVIPLYQQAKPLISNLGSTMSILKAFTATPKKESSKPQESTKNIKYIEETKTLPIANPPTFFM